jgi:hypothetical protein
VFLSSFQRVLNMFPNSSSFYPISFALKSFTLVIYITSPRWDYNIFILGLSKVRLIVLVMGQSKKPITKEKKNWTLGSPQLLDRNTFDLGLVKHKDLLEFFWCSGVGLIECTRVGILITLIVYPIFISLRKECWTCHWCLGLINSQKGGWVEWFYKSQTQMSQEPMNSFFFSSAGTR